MSDPVGWIEATASAVTHKNLKRKSDGRSFVLYNVETSQGTYTTAKRELAELAQRVLNQPARFLIKTEQRGDFTNYYLEDVQLVNGSVAAPPTPQQQQQPVVPQASVTTSQTPVGPPATQSGDPSQKDVYIFRQTAAKVAGPMSNTPEEFWTNCEDLVKFFTEGNRPNSGQKDTPDTSGRFLADDKTEYPLTAGSAPTDEGDGIPFMPTSYDNWL